MKFSNFRQNKVEVPWFTILEFLLRKFEKIQDRVMDLTFCWCWVASESKKIISEVFQGP